MHSWRCDSAAGAASCARSKHGQFEARRTGAGALDEAAAAYGRIQAAPALTADQHSYVLAKLDELQALRDGAAQFGVDVKQKRSRASTKHEGMIDAAALKEIEKI